MIETGSAALNGALTRLLTDLADVATTGAVLPTGQDIGQVTLYDFPQFEYVLEPRRHYELAADTHDTLAEAEFIGSAPIDIRDYTETLFQLMRAAIIDFFTPGGKRIIERSGDYETNVAWQSRGYLDQHINTFADALKTNIAAPLAHLRKFVVSADVFDRVVAQQLPALVTERMNAMAGRDGVMSFSQLRVFGRADGWGPVRAALLDALEAVPLDEAKIAARATRSSGGPQRGFTPYAANSVNFGLNIVYRQAWATLGYQPGEIVETVPLAPGQNVKLSITRTQKTTSRRASTRSVSSETAREEQTNSSASDEIVRETQMRARIEAQASVEGGFPGGKATGSIGVSAEAAKNARSQKSSMNSSAEKTASKMRQETKVEVSIQREDSLERQEVSEISNTNDEFPVTYIYSRMQRLYEVSSFLGSVDMVVYVAEETPGWRDLTGAWFRKHAEALYAAALADDVIADLSQVLQAEDEFNLGGALEDEDSGEVDPRIAGLFNSLTRSGTDGFPDYTGLSGTLPDIFRAPQEMFERELERARAARRARNDLRRAYRRIRAHVHANVMHYARAIWDREPDDERMMRYAQIAVPVNWRLQTEPGGTAASFAPVFEGADGDILPLSELISPFGPIAYVGNYSVHALKQSTRWSGLLDMLSAVKSSYMTTLVTATHVVGQDDGVAAILEGEASDMRGGEGRYLFEVSSAGVLATDLDSVTRYAPAVMTALRADGAIEYDDIRIRRADGRAFQPGDVVEATVTLVDALEDPEVKTERWRTPKLSEEEERRFYTPQRLAAMARRYKRVQTLLNIARAERDDPEWTDLGAGAQGQIRALFHDFLVRERNTKLIPVDTANLLMTRDVDRSSGLEPFKTAHRFTDALTAVAQLSQTSLENKRYGARLDMGDLADPETEERVTVIGADVDGVVVGDV